MGQIESVFSGESKQRRTSENSTSVRCDGPTKIQQKMSDCCVPLWRPTRKILPSIVRLNNGHQQVLQRVASAPRRTAGSHDHFPPRHGHDLKGPFLTRCSKLLPFFMSRRIPIQDTYAFRGRNRYGVSVMSAGNSELGRSILISIIQGKCRNFPIQLQNRIRTRQL